MNDKEEKQINENDHHERLSQRGIYLLPNLLTTAALFAGFYAIVAAMKGQFEKAAIAIFVSMIADGLDGRVARITGTQSEFGAEYDSLSDMAAFGIAPSLVIYSWSLYTLGKFGWLAAFLYTAATALRLARFNIQVADKNYFKGLPCPSAAGVLASTVWLGTSFHIVGYSIAIPLTLLTVILAGLMVSTIRYSSFKSLELKGRVPFITMVFAVFILAMIALEPPGVLFVLFMAFVISGPVLTLYHLHKLRKARRSDKNNTR